MDLFHEFLLDYLNHNRHCPKCGRKMWVGYGDAHVWDKCLSCPETLEELWNLDLAGYVTDFAVPTEPLPDVIETDDRDRSPWSKPHERYYRLKSGE